MRSRKSRRVKTMKLEISFKKFPTIIGYSEREEENGKIKKFGGRFIFETPSTSGNFTRRFDVSGQNREKEKKKKKKKGSPSLHFVRKMKQKNEKKMKQKYPFSIYGSVVPLERAWHNSNGDRAWLRNGVCCTTAINRWGTRTGSVAPLQWGLATAKSILVLAGEEIKG
ncbi:coiled-coil domain-containing protein KIAA1407 homolog [Striga asiatica]|uniref:Coiled-coil domain-containing protein KIAA1407 homolog n=1 Tax=Striga asiatica TaxID=4170 RepID=A0A5A7NYW7_STRAF|nr:coiled-coil domain-containing protein KIAA1407 homolog [Striga asiatica]